MQTSEIRRLIPGIELHPPASLQEIRSVERALRCELPADLKELLLQTNGIDGEYGHGLIWPIQRIEADNLEFRQFVDFRGLYMPFDHLLFFADAGDGDQFAHRILEGKVDAFNVYRWDHESDSRIWCARSVTDYLSRYADDTLT